MIHYTCDRCKKAINTDLDFRYEVNIVTQVVLDGPDVAGGEVDHDHLSEVDEMLQRIDEAECEQLCEDLYQARRFDMCVSCFMKYKQNPLGETPQQQVEFSEN
ncbi:MAG: hypothetical protein P8J33_04605 [Pirellulaceae bacterium]|nr:hypothetical protein [Pirellulaceae bacterium]